MEAQHPQQYYHHQIQPQNGNEEGGGSKNNGGGYLCRQSSTRWTPTTEQIRILKELYYNNGVRSPSAEQIQRISAKLRQYGKIEGKNVFYWFQNHKARERQKKRLTVTATTPDPAAAAATAFSIQMQRGVWRASDHCPAFNPAATTSPGVVSVGQIGNYGYGGTMAMERSFRNCSISAAAAGSNGVAGGSHHHHHQQQNYGWVGVDHPYSSTPYYPFLDKIKTVHLEDHHETLEEDHHLMMVADQQDDQDNEPETLPLFPIHADHHMSAAGTATDADQWCRRRYDDNAGSAAARASLELSLNSYNSYHHFP